VLRDLAFNSRSRLVVVLWWSGEATFVLRRKSPGLGRLGRKSRGLGKEAVDFLGCGDERE